jgi:hypothetical protein
VNKKKLSAKEKGRLRREPLVGLCTLFGEFLLRLFVHLELGLELFDALFLLMAGS